MIISKKSWHFKLLNFLGWVDTYYTTSLCPYFWKLVTALTLTLGLIPFLAMGMGLDAYSIFSPGMDALYEEHLEVAKAEATVEYDEAVTEAKEGEEIPLLDLDEVSAGLSPASLLMLHWNVTNYTLDWFLTAAMILGLVGWLCVGAGLLVGFFFLMKIGFEMLNDKTHVGTMIGSTVGTVIGKPARATGSIFSGWWKAHKEKHCPLIEFEDK